MRAVHRSRRIACCEPLIEPRPGCWRGSMPGSTGPTACLATCAPAGRPRRGAGRGGRSAPLARVAAAGDGRIGRLVRSMGGRATGRAPIRWRCSSCSCATASRSARRRAAGAVGRWLRRPGTALRRNDRAGARRNIAAHYDLGNDFYANGSTRRMTYSSAMFAAPTTRALEARAGDQAATRSSTAPAPAGRSHPRDRLRLGLVRRDRGARAGSRSTASRCRPSRRPMPSGGSARQG